MDREYAEKLYYKEEERKNELLHRISIVITIVGIALGLLYFILNRIIGYAIGILDHSWLYCGVFALTCAVTIIGLKYLMYSLVSIYKSLAVNKNYENLVSASRQYKFYKETLAFQQQENGNGELSDQNTVKKFNDYLVTKCIKATDYNELINQRNKKYLHSATANIFKALYMLGISAITSYVVTLLP